MLMGFQRNRAMVQPMREVFDRRHILAAQDAIHYFILNLRHKLSRMHEDIYWQKYSARFKSFPSVLMPDVPMAEMAVCIPVYAEPDLLLSLESLWQCTRPDTVIDVLVCFNVNDRMTLEERTLHDNIWKEMHLWVASHQHDKLRFKTIYYESLPDPKGGVGWARKMVMDEAARRLPQEGVMICLDGDCTIEKNYLQEIHEHFLSRPACDAASIYYEHPFENLDSNTHQAIIDYELHLRYLVHALRWTGHPYAFQTVGSSMAVRRRAYLAHGGMNTRMAGEDFYFLQKFIEVGSLEEIRSTTVYPSARISYRVPFGTGRAISHLLLQDEPWKTTSFAVYSDMSFLINKINRLRQICENKETSDKGALIKAEFISHPKLWKYLDSIDIISECIKINEQTASPSSFRKRFFRFFNAFKGIRYAHYMRDHFYPDVPVTVAVKELLHRMNLQSTVHETAEDYLLFFRAMDRAIEQNGDKAKQG